MDKPLPELDEKKRINKDQHLKLMICHIIGLLEVALNKHADMLDMSDLKIISEASLYLLHMKMNSQDRAAEESLDKIGGKTIYNEMAIEIKEWIFIYEPLVLRRTKQRPENKNDTSYDHAYLNEAYETIVNFLKRKIISIQRSNPSLKTEQATLGMLREYLTTGKCEIPLVKPSILAEQYAPSFNYYETRSKDMHEKLASFQKRIDHIDLKSILTMGVIGIRENWRENPIILERIHLEYLGVPKKEELLFRRSFLLKIQRNFSKSQENNDERLHNYIKIVNDFLVKINLSGDYDGSLEMEIALAAYLGEKDSSM